MGIDVSRNQGLESRGKLVEVIPRKKERVKGTEGALGGSREGWDQLWGTGRRRTREHSEMGTSVPWDNVWGVNHHCKLQSVRITDAFCGLLCAKQRRP